MAWNAQKNQIFFERARNWAASVQNLLEERNRLIALYANEASPGGNDDPAFVDVLDISTKAELVALATNVMTPLNNMINNVAVTTADRVEFLTPFLADQQ